MSTKSNTKKSTKSTKATKVEHVYPAVTIVNGMPENKKAYITRAAVGGGSKGGAKKVWQRALNACKKEVEKTLRAASLTGYRSNVAKAGHTSIGIWAQLPAK